MTDSAIGFGSVLPDGIDAVARGGIAASQRKLPPAVREVHRQLLRDFLRTGRAPAVARLRSLALANGLDLEQVIDELAHADLVHLDPAGEKILIAYPLSAGASAHQVVLDGGPTLTAMCAVDALGIPAMARSGARVLSRDPMTTEPIQITATEGEWVWEPATAVVLLAAAQCSGPIAYACQHTEFHASRELAERHLAAHPEHIGRVLSQAEAVEMAGTEFGALLADIAETDIAETDTAETKTAETDDAQAV
ncbi:MAG TPA: organomercurial lyase [Jatrophihabitans sp.]|jgi:hypothetical protein|uniref:organomercurial lyase n=1 Tax=Jatrophihabitans sp. TaxID=1932789 RepID=UPI002F2254F7